MKLTLLQLRLALAALLCMGAGLAHAGIRVNDDRGRSVELAQPAARIVSLLPSLTETVCALGACDRLVGVDRNSNWPASVQQLPRVGGMEDASVESVVALRPDVVLLRSGSRVVERLDALGIKVLALDTKTHADLRRVLETVAQVLGKPGAGEAYWQTLDTRFEVARARMPAGWQGRSVYIELHGGSAVASESSFIGETLARLGLHSVVPGNLGPFPRMSPEFIVRANPDLLMTPGPGELADRPGWSAMQAIRLGRYCKLPAARYEVLMRPGPRLDEAADEVVACIAQLGGRRP
ncbi:helical backbone metal receptor [Xylophilus sp. GW821-FHT01B05]